MKNKTFVLSLVATTIISTVAYATDSSYENCYGANNCRSCPQSTNCRYAINGDTMTVYGPAESSGNVGKIGMYAFYSKIKEGGDLNEVKNVIVSGNIESIEWGAFADNTGLESVKLNDAVKTIGINAFMNSSGITNLDLGKGIETIKAQAFYGMTGVMSLTIPDSVTTIEYNAFQNMTGVTSLTIPDSVITIGHNAFQGMSGVTSLTIPDSVTSIEYEAFRDMSNLETLYCPSTLSCANKGVGSTKIVTYEKDATTGVYSITDNKTNPPTTSYYSTLEHMQSGTTCNNVDGTCAKEAKDYQDAKLAKAAARSAAALQALLDKQAATLLASNTVCFDIETCKAIVYADYNGNIIKISGKDYASLADLQAGKHIPKRIYTIDEANAVAGPINRVSITYK